ncbi:MAG: Lipopolysaccharide assembly protein B [Bacteroidia bacterium]|nr:Lipopolysaccharide assembly protein B [Bacteroidia bacterium]
MLFSATATNNEDMMPSKNRITQLLLAGLLLCTVKAFSQKTAFYLDPAAEYRLATELYQKEKYTAAREKFENLTEQTAYLPLDLRVNAEFYTALCAVELFHKDAETLLQRFIDNHPESPKTKAAWFEMGKFQYRKKSWKKAVEWFEKLNTYDLNNEELAEYYFKSGYSYFMLTDFKNAKTNLDQIKGVENKYAAPASYYSAHISYIEENYETALQDFLKLENDKIFSNVVPFYITQLYFMQKKYDKVIEYGTPLLSSANTKRTPEIAKLVGESHFNKEQYKEAVPQLTFFIDNAGIITREDNYQLGYALYKTGDYDKAITYLEKVAGDADKLTQVAYYNIADCYLRSGKKPAARNSFKQASSFEFDKEIQEDALFNYAKLAYELSFNPYNEAITAFEEYIRKNPQSPRVEEAYSFLLDVYLTTKNYKQALESIELIKNKDDKMKRTYQRIAYYRAVELFNDLNYQSAIAHFDLSLKYPMDKEIEAGADYWKGEAKYKLNNYDGALAEYNKFLYVPGVNHDKYKTVNYNMGYAYFKKADYPNAVQWLRKYAAASDDNKKLCDAYIRIGDCYFLTRENQLAIDFYDKAVKVGTLDVDYALFQIAVCYGLQNKNESKIAALESLLNTYKNSSYSADAKYEIAESYLLNDALDNALTWFQRVINEHPKSAYVKKSLLSNAQIYYNKNNDDQALELFKKVYADYPGTSEKNDALLQIKKIYVESGKVQDFESWLKGNAPGFNVATLDTANYEVAEKKYLESKFSEAYDGFNTYLTKYPNGNFELNAKFYRAESAYHLKKYDEALEGYNYAIGRAKNIFTEKSLIRAADIHYFRNNYSDAKLMFAVLEEVAEVEQNLINARIGLMRCNYELGEYDEAARYAEKVTGMEKISDDILNEAHLIIAKSALAQEKEGLALAAFNKVANASQTAVGAEAEYNVAAIHYRQGNYDVCEKTIVNIIKNRPAYPYWIAKSFILLADNYVAKDDDFQAKLTLQNLIDKYEGQDLKKIAQDKLNAIIQRENDEELMKEMKIKEEIYIQFNENNKEQKLFEQEIMPSDTLQTPQNQ